METANDSVKFVRLVTGEDIISEVMEVEDTTGKHIILYNPLKIMYMSSPMTSDKVGISLLEWVFSRISDKQEFRIESKDILMVAPPSDSLNTYYWDTIEYFAKKKAGYGKEGTQEEKDKALKELMDMLDDLEEYADLGEEELAKLRKNEDILNSKPIEESEGYKMIEEFLQKRKGTLH